MGVRRDFESELVERFGGMFLGKGGGENRRFYEKV